MSPKSTFYFFITLVLVATFSSCTIMKRHYTRGFYVSSKGGQNEHAPTTAGREKKVPKQNKAIELLANELAAIAHTPETRGTSVKQQLTASNKKELASVQESPLGCDTLFLKDGTVIPARIVEISFYQVRFRYCAGADKSEKSIAKKEVDHITYANGTTERFDATTPAAGPRSYPPENRETNGFAIAGFVLSLLFYPALLLAFVLIWTSTLGSISGLAAVAVIAALIYLMGLVFSIVGIVQIANNGERYKGMALAIIGLLISLIPIILFASSLK